MSKRPLLELPLASGSRASSFVHGSFVSLASSQTAELERFLLAIEGTFFHRIITMNLAASCEPETSGAPDLRPVEGDAADSELAEILRALAHPARVHILRMLSRQNSCICGDFVSEIGLAQSTVSQHLKVMKQAMLIRGEVEGTRVCYCLNRSTLRRFKALVGGL